MKEYKDHYYLKPDHNIDSIRRMIKMSGKTSIIHNHESGKKCKAKHKCETVPASG